MRARWLALALFWLCCPPAQAAEPQALGKNENWEGYRYKSGDQQICYMISHPGPDGKAMEGRGQVFVFITHRPRRRQFDEVTFDIGYTFKPDSALTVTIGSEKFSLATEKQHAWADEVRLDRQLVAAMKRGESMVVEGASSRDLASKDIFPLKGFTATYRLISDECR